MKVIISGGGTGGHVFPAIAIAQALKKAKPEIDLLFVGAQGRMEMEKVPAASFRIIGIKISGFQRRLTWKNLVFPFKVLAALQHARKIINAFAPDVVVGVGGYASGPVVRVASGRGIPAVLQEQNSYPGVTNKLLAKKASRICVAYDGMEKFFPKEKIFMTGNPVRQDVVNLTGKRIRAMEEFKLDPEKPVALVLGGSLGARTINESIHTGLEKFAEAGVQLVWQTGKSYIAFAKEAVGLDNRNVRVMDFITRMDLAYAAADIVVSRAGAISISELCLVKKPVILVPSPNVAEDHQTRNALALVNYQAAILVKDAEAREKLTDEMLRLIRDRELCAKLSSNISPLGKQNAAEAIASVIFGAIK